MTATVHTIAIVGTGVIGAGWTVRCLAYGLDVIATDPDPNAEPKIRAAVDSAWSTMERQGIAPGASRDRLTFVRSVEEAAERADFIQENAPEREHLKQDLLARIDAVARPGAVIASSV